MQDVTKTTMTELLALNQQVATWHLGQLDAFAKQTEAAMAFARNTLTTQHDFAQNLGKTFVDAK